MKRKSCSQWAMALVSVLTSVWCLNAREGVLNGAVKAPQPQSGTPTEPEKHALTVAERADLFMARKQYADAAETDGQALRRPGLPGEETASLWNRLGIALQAELRYGPARKAYKNALHFRKDFPEPWNNLGTTYFMQKKYGKSAKYYQRAIQLNGQSASFHMNLGTTDYHLDRFDKAVLEYRAALLLDPDILSKHAEMGTVVETRESDPKFYYYLAKSFANLGRVDDAVRYLGRAFEDV